MVLFGMIGFIVLSLVAFGWWTIGFPRRRMWGGALLLVVAFLFSPLLLVVSGERFGFDGVVAGLVGLSCVVGGGFFFSHSDGPGDRRKSAKYGLCQRTLICFEPGCHPTSETRTVKASNLMEE
ncbi:hypothetical protein [Exiguobacterium mexicanum]|uniref:hypothetical protein n=1 Tax=Exiguobacterium mexicanum TaxID=340146 RepID=UPI0037BE3A13